LYARNLPFIGGQEGGGTIVATTPAAEAEGFRVGDQVIYSVFGSYAEFTVSFVALVGTSHAPL
jgi:NADPH2:quinone reductase